MVKSKGGSKKNSTKKTLKIANKSKGTRTTTRLNHELICRIIEKVNQLEKYIEYLEKERRTHHTALNILRGDIVSMREQDGMAKMQNDEQQNEMELFKYDDDVINTIDYILK